jgi:hypothetical protein
MTTPTNRIIKERKSLLFATFCLLIVFFAQIANARQSSTPASSPTPVPGNTTSPEQVTKTIINQQRQREDSFARLRQADKARNFNRTIFEVLRKDINTLYRRSSKKELKALAVNPSDEKRYEVFLRQANYGLIKFIDNPGCSEDLNVIVVTENCLKYSIPGGGSSYSFRIKDYRIPWLADLTYSDNIFQVTGKLSHGILTGIGDVPLENVNLQNIPAKYVVDFQPVTKYEEAVSIDRQLAEGIDKEGFIYSSELNAVDNMTYVLRSVAYDGELYRAINGVTYNELNFDKRRDVTIAFRIVNREDDKSVTILWKELENKNSPKIKKESEDKTQVKENKFVAKTGKI